MKFLRVFAPFTEWKMVSVKTEIFLVKTFRILLPAIMVLLLWWADEASPDLRNTLLNSLGANANHMIFFGGLALIVVLYRFMGIYERRIFYESHHLKTPLLRRPEE